MAKSFNEYRQQRDSQVFSEGFHHLCETMAENGIPFEEVWSESVIPTLLSQSHEMESEQDLLNEILGSVWNKLKGLGKPAPKGRPADSSPVEEPNDNDEEHVDILNVDDDDFDPFEDDTPKKREPRYDQGGDYEPEELADDPDDIMTMSDEELAKRHGGQPSDHIDEPIPDADGKVYLFPDDDDPDDYELKMPQGDDADLSDDDDYDARVQSFLDKGRKDRASGARDPDVSNIRPRTNGRLGHPNDGLDQGYTGDDGPKLSDYDPSSGEGDVFKKQAPGWFGQGFTDDPEYDADAERILQQKRDARNANSDDLDPLPSDVIDDFDEPYTPPSNRPTPTSTSQRKPFDFTPSPGSVGDDYVHRDVKANDVNFRSLLKKGTDGRMYFKGHPVSMDGVDGPISINGRRLKRNQNGEYVTDLGPVSPVQMPTQSAYPSSNWPNDSGSSVADISGTDPVRSQQTYSPPGYSQTRDPNGFDVNISPRTPANLGPKVSPPPKPTDPKPDPLQQRGVNGPAQNTQQGAQPNPQQQSRDQRLKAFQSNVDGMTKDIKDRFAQSMRSFSKAVSDDAKKQNNPHMWGIAQKFYKAIMGAAQPTIDSFAMKTKFGKVADSSYMKQFNQERGAMQQNQQQNMKTNLANKFGQSSSVPSTPSGHLTMPQI